MKFSFIMCQSYDKIMSTFYPKPNLWITLKWGQNHVSSLLLSDMVPGIQEVSVNVELNWIESKGMNPIIMLFAYQIYDYFLMNVKGINMLLENKIILWEMRF